MTFKDLQKLIQKEQAITVTKLEQDQQDNPKLTDLLQRLKDKPFWIWDPTDHKKRCEQTNSNCCFNHIIGLPRKDGIPKPFFPYEKLIYDAMFTDCYKHVFIKKATGLGITEIMLRIAVWLCTKDDNFKEKQIVLVTGPNITLAITLIKRIKGLFLKHNITFDSKETVLDLNGCHIECYPSHHVDAFRALE